MAALSALDLLYAGIGFTVFVAGFLAGCALFALLEPSHDPLDNYVDGFGDVPALPSDLKIRNHGERNTL